MTTGWKCFDKIYCISLTERTDRRATAMAQFEAVGLSSRVEFVIVDRHPTDCEQGCYESHMTCMKKGLAEGVERMLIFEDDIIFDRFSDGLLERARDFCLWHTGWHMLFLGCMVKASCRTSYPAIRKIKFRSLTHAYAIHRRFAEKLVQRPWRQIPYDDFLRDLKDREIYALYPSIAFQSNARSDNERYLLLDRIRRVLGGLRNLQKFDEFYHRWRSLIIGVHLLAALLILWAIL
jgi:GR25 family glycosyltransferase involved in LPS biosynthesis